MMLARALSSLVKSGDLTVLDAGGKMHRFGIPGQDPKSVIRLHDKALHHKLLIYPDLYLGEAYMNGTLTLEEGGLNDFLTLLAMNVSVAKPTLPERIAEKFIPLLQRIQQHNTIGQAQRNVAYHYDISVKLFELFLDKNMQYSCAYYTKPDNNLDQAQLDKMYHIASKLCLKPGMKVLDAGSGWGGLAIYLARTMGVEVTGVTLSAEQLKKATERVKEAGFQDKIHFYQKDFREMTGSFDRIVSVGMLEHIGVGFYKQFFAKTNELLTAGGIALIHSIGSPEGPRTSNAWMRKYIFPGGYAPALSEIARVVEKSGLLMTDIEILQLHYAYTLRDWQKKFRDNWKTAAALFDERFCRMWEFFLVSAEMEFRYYRTAVFQIQLSKNVNAIPATRDYMNSLRQEQMISSIVSPTIPVNESLESIGKLHATHIPISDKGNRVSLEYSRECNQSVTTRS